MQIRHIYTKSSSPLWNISSGISVIFCLFSFKVHRQTGHFGSSMTDKWTQLDSGDEWMQTVWWFILMSVTGWGTRTPQPAAFSEWNSNHMEVQEIPFHVPHLRNTQTHWADYFPLQMGRDPLVKVVFYILHQECNKPKVWDRQCYHSLLLINCDLSVTV